MYICKILLLHSWMSASWKIYPCDGRNKKSSILEDRKVIRQAPRGERDATLPSDGPALAVASGRGVVGDSGDSLEIAGGAKAIGAPSAGPQSMLVVILFYNNFGLLWQ